VSAYWAPPEIPEWQTYEDFRSFLYDPIGSKDATIGALAKLQKTKPKWKGK